jgi:hypothetical protein
MNFQGMWIGLASFVIIGIFHPIVIKAEYHVGLKIWPVFLIGGIASITLSLFVREVALSAVIGIFGFACLWSIRELHEQVQRVRKGWFPANPKK